MKKKNLTVLLALLLAAGVVSCAALESASAWPASSGAAPYGASRLRLRGFRARRTLELRRFGARRAFRLRRHALRRLTLRALEAGGAPFRHELKFLVTRGEGFALSSRFSALFARDGHAGADGRYEVHSLYFDTPDDRALREKLYGLRDKEKFRLRYYGGSRRR